MKFARRPATSSILLMTGSLVLAGCANSSLGRDPFSQAPPAGLLQHPTRPAAIEQESNVVQSAVPNRQQTAGLGLIQPVSAELAASESDAILLPVPLSAEEAEAVDSIAEVTPPLVIGRGQSVSNSIPVADAQAVEHMPMVEGEYVGDPMIGEEYIGDPADYPHGLLHGLAGKKQAKKEYRETLKLMSLKGKDAKHKQKERRDIGYNNVAIGRELRMKSHPMYVVEPPDVLYIEATMLLPERPVMGERLVRQDGTISLGYYGQIHVAGLTLFEIEEKIRERLREYVQNPQVYVDVAAFNSKVYYVLGQVQQTGRLPITGKETVLDAITLAGGLTNFADISEIHIARPNPGGGCDQILHVDYRALADCGDTRTNYQLLPGDRVVVPGTRGFKTNVFFDNFLSPFERLASLGSLIRFTLD